MSEEYSEGPFDLITAEEAAFAPMRFRLIRDMTPERYDQLRSVLEAVADSGDDYCRYCGANNHLDNHREDCYTPIARTLLTLLPPRG